MADLPADGFWTEAQIAAAELRDMPATARGVHAVVKREGWRASPAHARRRQDGWVYHEALFPPLARADLAARRAAGTAEAAPDEGAAWAAFERMTDAQRASALARAATLEAVAQLIQAGLSVRTAVETAARRSGASASAVWSWWGRVAGVRRDSWAPHLVDARSARGAAGPVAEMSEAAWEAFLADYLRPEKASLESCWRRVEGLAARNGWVWPCSRAVRRRVEREIPAEVLVLARDGREELKRRYPAQRRDRSGLHALACVNADGHRWDVAVAWPDGTVQRPCMVAWQDIYSGKVLGWRIAQTENATSALLSLGDMVEDWGIPEAVVLDNGRAFASKWLTGQDPNRRRFKWKADEPLGVLKTLHTEIHWATPYHGQAKPIERAFRDFCGDIAKHPAFSGAYLGNSPVNKPENYGARAVPLAEFERVVAEGVAEHNARLGRRGGLCEGRSFDQVFAESYEASLIRKAAPAQRRMFLLACQGLTGRKDGGRLEFMGNVYWGELSSSIEGRKVTVRFDPADLHAGLHVYSQDNAYLGHVPCMEKGGFLCSADAQTHARARKAYLRAAKAQLDALRTMDAAELASRLAGTPTPEAPKPAARVVRGQFGGAALARAAFAEAWDEQETIDIAAAQRAQERGIRLAWSGGDD